MHSQSDKGLGKRARGVRKQKPLLHVYEDKQVPMVYTTNVNCENHSCTREKSFTRIH